MSPSAETRAPKLHFSRALKSYKMVLDTWLVPHDCKGDTLSSGVVWGRGKRARYSVFGPIFDVKLNQN